jgi:DNA-binding beta-propeller fold protein YncE
MKFGRLKIFGLLFITCALMVAGCGGGSAAGNVVTVSVSPSAFTVIVTQSLTLTAIVSGSTNTDVTWTCQFTTTTVDSTGKATTSTPADCKTETGTIPANSKSTTVVYTAPQNVPDPKTFPNLSIIITATSVADTKKSGKATLAIDSGIAVGLTPTTATVPTSSSATAQSQFQFTATLINDIGTTKGVTWLVTQGTPTSTVPYPQLATCSPGCGSIDQSGLYSAPTAVPTAASLTLVVSSKADPTRFALGTITIIKGGTIAFNGISPTVVPQGVAFYDLYLDAANVTSSAFVTLTADTGGGSQVILSTSGQLKVLFPIPTSTVANPASTGIRLRLLPANIPEADTYTVAITDPSQQLKLGSGPFKFSVVPVRASTVVSLPDSIVQNAQGNELRMIVNGGYFGPNGSFVQTTFEGNTVPFDTSSTASSSTARQLNLAFPSSSASNAQPGLYQLSVARTKSPLPAQNNPSVTNLAIFPDYQNVFPTAGSSTSSGVGGTLVQPSAIDIDPEVGVAAVAVAGGNRVEFFKITAGAVTAIGTTAQINIPTSVSVNRALHQVAVVSFKDQSVSVFPIPSASTATPIAPITTVSLKGLIPSQQTPLPFPYSIAVDPDTNHAIVAYSSSSNPTTAKVGFLLDLTAGNADCIVIPSQPANTKSPCISGQVTLNTGLYPQAAIVPHTHTAVVTPGGLGITNGVDVLKSSSSVGVMNVSLTSGLVTVTTTASHGLNPGNPGTVLIEGVPKGTTNQVEFNGAFTVQSVINSTSFTYALNSAVNDTATGTADSTVFFGSPNISIGGLSQTTQGVAVNPITGLVAAADANATGQNGPQINLLNSLDQNISSITFRAGCTVYTTSCTGAPELLGTTSVSFQPFANSLVSYNAAQNQLSVSNPVTQARYAFLQLTPAPPTSQASTIPAATTGFSVDITLSGGVVVDAATNQAIVVEPASGTVLLVNLGPTSLQLKPVQVSEVLVPSAAPSDPKTIGGIPGAAFPQGTLTSATDLVGVKIFGSGFTNGTAVVRLDGTAITTPAPFSDREIDVTIPATFLKFPHRYALDVFSGGVTSNASDFIVVKAIDLSNICKDASNNPVPTKPASVAIADQLVLSGFAPKAIVSNGGCNSVSVVDIAPQLPTYDSAGHLTGFSDNASFGGFTNIPTGSNPAGVAISPRFGLAVVANNSAGTVSILDILAGKQKIADVTTGSSPTGVAINEGTGATLVANTGSNTVSEINLGLLFPPTGTTAPTTLTATTIGVDTEPIAVAIDPDRGTNNRGLAVVTALALTSSFPRGVLDSVDIGSTVPAKSTTAAVGSVTATPTGVVFDPSVFPAQFYAVSSGGNVISSFNPDTGASSTVHVGINPTSLALNPQTGAILTVNSISNTISIVDTLTSPFKTRRSFGIPGSPQMGVAIDQFLNLAVIADQAHDRVLLFPMPN